MSDFVNGYIDGRLDEACTRINLNTWGIPDTSSVVVRVPVTRVTSLLLVQDSRGQELARFAATQVGVAECTAYCRALGLP